MGDTNQPLTSTPAPELFATPEQALPATAKSDKPIEVVPNFRSIVNTGIVDASTYSSPNKSVTTPQHVLITGLGRGGTTALAKIFEALGISFKEATAVMENQSYRGLYQLGRTDKLVNIFDYSEHADRCAWKEPKLRSAAGIELVKLFPPVVGVAVIFRDVLATSIRNTLTVDRELFEALEGAARETKKLITFVHSVKDRPLLLISYEKLLLESVGVVKEIAKWIGVDDAEKISQAVHAIQPNSVAYLQATLTASKK